MQFDLPKFGTQGQVLLFQKHPFECQSNYDGLGALRCNLDMQDLRRVFPETDWLDDELPHFGHRPEYGYMNTYEWDGENWVQRRADSECELDEASARWNNDVPVADWRKVLLHCLTGCQDDIACPEHRELYHKLEGAATVSFSDGLGIGCYINVYIMQHCPAIEGMLEEMRRGLERLQQTR